MDSIQRTTIRNISFQLLPHPEATVITVGPGALDKERCVVPTSVKAGDGVLLLAGEVVRLKPERMYVGFFFSFLSFLSGLIWFWFSVGILPF